MQKTKLGIPVGLLAAGIYFTGLFGGYLVAVLLTAYVLLVEDDEWLRRSSVKAVILMAVLSLTTTILGFFPDVLGVISSFLSIFGVNFTYYTFSTIISVFVQIIDILRYVFFIILGVKALRGRSVAIPIVDSLIYKYMG